MNEQKEKLFNVSLFRLVSASDFLGLLKTGFFVWLILYGFCLVFFLGFNWLGDLAGDSVGIKFNNWTDPIFKKSVSFWVVCLVFCWILFSFGVRNILKDIGNFFHNLSKYPTTEIFVAVILFAIIPWLPFLFLPILF